MVRIIKILATLLIITVIAVVVIISKLDINQYKSEIIKLVEQETGRKLQIGGDLQFAVSLIPTVAIEDVRLSNANWGSAADMLSLDKLEVKVALLPLLSGNIQINKIILLAPKILLETNKKGVGNWVFSSKEIAEKLPVESTGDTPNIIVENVLLKNATIVYIDGITGEKTNLVIDNMRVDSTGNDKPLSVLINASYNTLVIEVKGSVGSLGKLTNNENYPVDLRMMVSDIEIDLKGMIAEPMDGKGIDLGINLELDSLADLSQVTGNKLPNIGPVTFIGKITDSKGMYSIKAMKLELGKTDIYGDVTADLSGKRPTITANLNSNLIDLVELMAGEQQAKQGSQKDKIFSSEPLPLDSLKSLNARVKINAKKIKTNSLTLDKTTISMNLKDGNLMIKPLNTLLAGGTLNGHVGLNSSGKIATLVTDIAIKKLQPAKLGNLKNSISGAVTDITIKVSGRGNSVSQIMAGLNGNVVLHSGKGKSSSRGMNTVTKDLLTMLNPVAKSKGTQLDCAVVNLKIKDGVALADKGIVFSTSQMNIIGSGTVDLKTEKLDIAFSPHAREGVGINASKLAGLVKLGGTLANPKPAADLKGTVTTGLSVGAAVATGGLSLLAEGLLDRTTSDADPCATALGMKSARQAEQKQIKPKAESNPKPVEAIKDVGSAAVDKVKGLFR